MKISEDIEVEINNGDFKADHVIITESTQFEGKAMVVIHPSEYLLIVRELKKAWEIWTKDQEKKALK